MYTYTYTYIYIKAYINKENDFCKLWEDVYVTNSHACMYDKFIFYSIIYCYNPIKPPFSS